MVWHLPRGPMRRRWRDSAVGLGGGGGEELANLLVRRLGREASVALAAAFSRLA